MVVTEKSSHHPLYIEMISKALAELKGRKGVSRQAIVKYIKANYKVSDNVETVTKMTLKRNVKGGKIVQVSGSGASGSFKLALSTSKATPVAKKPSLKKVVAVRKSPAKKATPKKKKIDTKKRKIDTKKKKIDMKKRKKVQAKLKPKGTSKGKKGAAKKK